MSKKGKRSHWLPSLIFRIIIIVAAFSLAISYISIYVNPSFTSIPLFFGLYFIPLALFNVLLLIIGVVRRSGATWITFIALLPSILFAELFIRWGEVQRGDEGISLRVCTYNVGLFSQGNDKNPESSAAGVAAFLRDEKIDIACLQEFFVKDTAHISLIFKDYPYRYYHLFQTRKGARFGNITLSKFPISNGGKITFRGSTNLCIYTDIDHFGKTIRVYNTHLESHSISFTALMKRMRESRKVTEEIYEVHDKLAGTFRKRALQADSILIHAKNSTHPAIICGDFNDTPMSYTYKSLTSDRKDSFRQSGRGFSATYSFLWPLLRIDYILYPAPIWSISHRTPGEGFSDHYPVISELIIP
jgi:endonuclease/exonuclease/phosphatase family metal-dependent hydrolase